MFTNRALETNRYIIERNPSSFNDWSTSAKHRPSSAIVGSRFSSRYSSGTTTTIILSHHHTTTTPVIAAAAAAPEHETDTSTNTSNSRRRRQQRQSSPFLLPTTSTREPEPELLRPSLARPKRRALVSRRS
ncbi:hypothetical protein V1478_011528 [Vespula squamosa]|uniref:Uncharacterized protein n=1 Tax=Vespula squamosa TaxID=30214 RepID=A0ABD2AER0_VESSQ